jgi:diguanylate cyclase (GGDEF)-like protein/PAS domain S-box-containing protein
MNLKGGVSDLTWISSYADGVLVKTSFQWKIRGIILLLLLCLYAGMVYLTISTDCRHGSVAAASMLLVIALTWTLLANLKRIDRMSSELTAKQAALLSSEQRYERLVNSLDGIVWEQIRTLQEMELAAYVFEQSKQAIVITDLEGTILRVNGYFTELTGYTAEEATGKTPRILKSQRQDDAFYAELWKGLREKGEWSGEIWNRKKNGDGFAAMLNITSVRNEVGTILYYIGINQDITQQKLSSERIYHLAHYDILTDLANRQNFNDRLNLALRQAERSGRQLAILFLDLDDFKKVNDILGHHAGDLLLQEVAQRLLGCVRNTDPVARLGGDEFAILLEDIDQPDHVERVVQKIIPAISAPLELEGMTVSVGVSIGISIYPGDGSDIVSLCKNADMAMYRAKAMGKNCCQFFDIAMAVEVANRLAMEADLRDAIGREFFLLYQPQAEVRGNAIIGVEVLVQWRHPRHGIINPANFIRFAEETGMINRLGEWVLATACRQAAHWHHEKGISLRVAVNVSPLQLEQTSFFDMVERIIRETGIPSFLLELELTESVLMSKVAETAETFRRLKDLGVNIAVDDFGAGYSSLSSLKKLPIDRLKIDSSFISKLPDNKEDLAIIRAIIAMARSLSLKVIAEGVETCDQLDFLKAEGCEEFQGFVLAKPLTAGELEQLLERSGRIAYAIAHPLHKAFPVRFDELPYLSETPAVRREKCGG